MNRTMAKPKAAAKPKKAPPKKKPPTKKAPTKRLPKGHGLTRAVANKDPDTNKAKWQRWRVRRGPQGPATLNYRPTPKPVPQPSLEDQMISRIKIPNLLSSDFETAERLAREAVRANGIGTHGYDYEHHGERDKQHLHNLVEGSLEHAFQGKLSRYNAQVEAARALARGQPIENILRPLTNDIVTRTIRNNTVVDRNRLDREAFEARHRPDVPLRDRTPIPEPPPPPPPRDTRMSEAPPLPRPPRGPRSPPIRDTRMREAPPLPEPVVRDTSMREAPILRPPRAPRPPPEPRIRDTRMREATPISPPDPRFTRESAPSPEGSPMHSSPSIKSEPYSPPGAPPQPPPRRLPSVVAKREPSLQPIAPPRRSPSIASSSAMSTTPIKEEPDTEALRRYRYTARAPSISVKDEPISPPIKPEPNLEALNNYRQRSPSIPIKEEPIKPEPLSPPSTTSSVMNLDSPDIKQEPSPEVPIKQEPPSPEATPAPRVDKGKGPVVKAEPNGSSSGTSTQTINVPIKVTVQTGQAQVQGSNGGPSGEDPHPTPPPAPTTTTPPVVVSERGPPPAPTTLNHPPMSELQDQPTVVQPERGYPRAPTTLTHPQIRELPPDSIPPIIPERRRQSSYPSVELQRPTKRFAESGGLPGQARNENGEIYQASFYNANDPINTSFLPNIGYQ